MNTLLNLRVATLATLALSAVGTSQPAIANSLFGQQEVNQSQYAIVASPYGGTFHQLLILKQISNVRPCWSESGSSPTTINPLLLEFDFTDICGRSTDSNGYSIRTGGEDLNWRYSFRVARRGNELHLLGVPNVDRSAPELLIGRTRGYNPGFSKFYLEPGWRLAERAYQGTSVGHVYLTNDQTLASLNATAIPQGSASQPAARSVSAPVATNPIVTKPVVSTPIVTNPIATNPVFTNPVVVVNPTPTVSTPQPKVQAPVTKPVQRKRPNFWQRVWGQR